MKNRVLTTAALLLAALIALSFLFSCRKSDALTEKETNRIFDGLAPLMEKEESWQKDFLFYFKGSALYRTEEGVKYFGEGAEDDDELPALLEDFQSHFLENGFFDRADCASVTGRDLPPKTLFIKFGKDAPAICEELVPVQLTVAVHDAGHTVLKIIYMVNDDETEAVFCFSLAEDALDGVLKSLGIGS